MQNGYSPLREVNVIRYVTPLREGGSLPAIAEADDGFLYVLKFRGAGQGVKALIAELIGGEIARTLGLKTPELVLANLDTAFGRTEPDEEIQDLLKASVGLNIGLHYLSGAITFDPVTTKVEPLLASKIVWLDCLLTNVDRTVRNTNMLIWGMTESGKKNIARFGHTANVGPSDEPLSAAPGKELWLIDHGAALYFHHSWDNWEEQARRPFTMVKDHVLLPQAAELDKADAEFRSVLTPDRIRAIVGLIPDSWLSGISGPSTGEEARKVYADFLETRIAASAIFLKEAQHAREALI